MPGDSRNVREFFVLSMLFFLAGGEGRRYFRVNLFSHAVCWLRASRIDRAFSSAGRRARAVSRDDPVRRLLPRVFP